MSTTLTLMAVHAHPDDEAIGTGGVLARYAAEGIRTVLVTCTNGEAGEIADPALATPDNLGEVRLRELQAACDILGVSELYLLGYRDSGMAGRPENDDPRSFHRAPLDEAVGRLVAVMRRERPQVVITYDENGFYGHPDHIKANQITVAAFDAAADPSRYPAAGPPWQPAKLYYIAVPRSRMTEMPRVLRAAGITPPFEGEPEPDGAALGTPDELITTSIDVAAQIERKHRALLAHASQMGEDVFFARLSPSLFAELFSVESFQLVRSLVPASSREDDLFAGLR